MFFSGNRARLGSAVYTNQIGLCSWTGVEGGQRPFFNRSQAFRWKSITYRYSKNRIDDNNYYSYGQHWYLFFFFFFGLPYYIC